MVKNYKLLALFVAILLIGFTNSTQGQDRIIDVAPGFGTLNEAIDGDTTATGERVDENTIYRLQRDGIYILNGAIENDGYAITIVAEDGAGARPQLIPGVPTGGESDRPFRPKGDVTLKGLYISGMDELGGIPGRMIRVSAENLNIFIEDCHLDKDNQSAFRLDESGTDIRLINSIISNIGHPLDPNNGRGIDDRGNDIDTLVMLNCTFYNMTSRVLRDGGGYINYAEITHNTFYNIGQFVMSFGEIVTLVFNDNLVVNGGFYGRNTNAVEGNSLASANAQWIQLLALGDDLIGEGKVQTVDISNNNFYLDPAYEAAYPDTVEVVPVLDSLATFYVDQNGTAASNITEAIAFTNAPPVEVAIVETYWADPANAPEWDNTNAPFDFGYAAGSTSYSHATGGEPLGDLNWHDTFTDVGDDMVIVPSSFALNANYPNPFNPTTNISYTIPEQGIVKLTIYNMLGQAITTLVNEVQPAGTHEITWNGKSSSGAHVVSGLYIYQLSTGNNVATRKMMLLK